MKHWLLLTVLLAACGNSAHPGFKEVSTDVYLRYHSLGEGEELVQPSDSIELLLRATEADGAPGSLLSTQQWYAAEDLMHGGLLPVFERIHVGDSISLIAAAQQFPWTAISPMELVLPNENVEIQLELSLLRIRTAEMMAAEQVRHRRSDPEGYQRKLMNAFLQRSGLTWQVWGSSDLHYRIQGEATDTNRVKQGDVVFVSWRGKRLEDGVVVDDNFEQEAPFSFRFGDQDQVIVGIETVVTLLREGQEGEFIIPAEMAFGARGVEGLVEPWSPLHYKVKLERVDRR